MSDPMKVRGLGIYTYWVCLALLCIFMTLSVGAFGNSAISKSCERQADELQRIREALERAYPPPAVKEKP